MRRRRKPTAGGHWQPILLFNFGLPQAVGLLSSRVDVKLCPMYAALCSRHFSSLLPLTGSALEPSRVARAVSSFLVAPASEQASSLESLHAAAGATRAALTAPLHSAVTFSTEALPFMRAVRARCASAGASAWASDVDAAALRATESLYSPSFTELVALTREARAGSAVAALRDAAAAAETVAAAHGDAFAYKFGARRVVYALRHVAEPSELLAVLYAALLANPPRSFAELDSMSGGVGGKSWALRDAAAVSPAPKTAVFYSVSSSAPVTRGLRLGTRIIYALAGAIATAAPSIETFCTLSPIPNFCDYLSREAAMEASSNAAESPLSSALRRAVGASANERVVSNAASAVRAGARDPVSAQLCAAALEHYILRARDARGHPACKVAAFHFANGATLGRLCEAADESTMGRNRSGGWMASYVYSRNGAAGLQRTIEVAAAAYGNNPEVVRRGMPSPTVSWRER